MAHSPISRPESSEPYKSRTASTAAESAGAAESEAASQLTRWQTILSTHGGGTVSADLALDLVLNEIVEVTRESTHANAAAIALARGGEIVCRATTGEGAPGLGVRLSGDTGLSAACVQTGNWQRCDDSEKDARVDAELCRRLGVRSILVVPVLKTGELLGVLEIFSAQVAAFGDREVRTLQMLSRSVVENIELARRASANSEPVASHEVAGAERNRVGQAAAEETVGSSTSGAEPGPGTADYWTGALMVAVVVLAVTLGWMVGRGGRQGAKANAERQGSPELQTKPEAVRADGPANPATKPAGTGGSSGESHGELIVYQNGKMVFPAPQTRDAEQNSTTAAAVERAVETNKVQAAGPVRIPPEVAAGYVTSRVEPEYPAHARERHVQGEVVLDALIGKDGSVRKFTAIRGDPELAAAASSAVRQWRFRPLVRNGQSEDFQTRITVVFRLPESG